MKILVTGATGFVGSYVARDCVSRGHEVTALVRASSNTTSLKQLGAQLVFGDLGSSQQNSVSMPECDVVIHIAGLIKAKNTQDFYRVNTFGTRWLLDQLRYQEIKKFIYVSSISARGPNQNSTSFDGKGAVSHYGKSKVQGEKIVLEYQNRFPVCIVRPPIVYGPGDPETLTLFRFFRRGFFPVIGKIPLKNSFIQVRDLSAMLIAMAEHQGPTPSGRISASGAPGAESSASGPYYPDDGNSGYELDEMLGFAANVVGRKVRRIMVPIGLARMVAWFSELGGDVFGNTPLLNSDKFKEMSQPFWFCSANSLQETFRVSPTVSLNEGLKEALAWYKQEGWL